MKRLFLVSSFLFITIILAASKSLAQIPFNFGVKGALNFASATLTDGTNPVPAISSRTAFGFAGVVEYELNSLISLQAEPQYIQKGAKTSATDPTFGTVTGTGKFNYFEIPVLVKIGFDAMLIKPYVFAGPAVGFLTSASGESEYQGLTASIDMKDKTKSTEFSLNFGGGIAYPIAPLLSLTGDIRYSLGLTNIAKPQSPTDKSDWKSRDVKVFVGLLLSL